MARVSRKNRKIVELAPSYVPEKIYRTAVYARLSVEDNGQESESIENQIAMMQNFIAQRTDLVVQDIYIDNGYTGTNFLRPRWQAVMAAAQTGLIDCIIVKDLSRLGRNYIETGNFLEKVCPFLNIRFIAITNNLDTAELTDTQQLSVAIANIINDCYAKDISRKVYSALDTKIQNGEFIGNWAPYGYLRDPENKNHLIIDPETADVVRRIYLMRSEGTSYSKINRILNEENILSPSQLKAVRGIRTNNNQKKRPILWNKHMTTEILNNILYAGHLAQRKGTQCLYAGIPYHLTTPEEWVIVYNTHEPIISEQLFDTVQAINASARQKTVQWQGKYSHLPKAKNFYGKKFVCADCGATMKLHRSFSTKKDKVYFTFNCPTYVEHGNLACSSKKMRKADLDEAVLQAVKAQIAAFMDTSLLFEQMLSLNRCQRATYDRSAEIKRIDRQIESKRATYSNTYFDLKSGLLTESEYHQVRSLLSREIKKLEEKRSRLADEDEKISMGKDKLDYWKEKIAAFENATEVTPELLECLVEKIQMKADGSLLIQFSFDAVLEQTAQLCEALRREEVSLYA